MANNNIQFLLNDQLIYLTDVDPNLMVLQYLREQQCLTGTKEGCGSGDCGACTVVVAELNLDQNGLNYKSINACITFIGNLHGKQLLTVEHLKQTNLTQSNKPTNQLHPVQQAMVDCHASQCGFCTPGIVMSCFALHKNNSTPNREEVVEALAGNLCRCTGYRPIIDAAMQSTDLSTRGPQKDSFIQSYQETINSLKKLNGLKSLNFQKDNKSYFAPHNTKELSKYLLIHPNAILFSGGTDLALTVTQNLAEIEQLVYLGNVVELNKISEDANEIIIGAAAPYSDFRQVLGKNYPELGEMIDRIGSTQIRNTGTLGGNIGNASPIGDMPPALIALNARMILQLANDTREIAVEDYFISYKQTVLKSSEFIKEIIIEKPKANQFFKVYKISKRFDDDISAVLVALSIELDNGVVKTIRIGFGGMDAIPKRAKNCEDALHGKSFVQNNIDLAKQALTTDFSPMSDVRASADYRMKVAQNIIQKFYLEIVNENQLTRVANHA
jgi:xanthine dehydrogenase small subunit